MYVCIHAILFVFFCSSAYHQDSGCVCVCVCVQVCMYVLISLSPEHMYTKNVKSRVCIIRSIC